MDDHKYRFAGNSGCSQYSICGIFIGTDQHNPGTWVLPARYFGFYLSGTADRAPF